MSKLHEVLAVEGDLEGAFKSILKEAAHTFSKKAHLFTGYNRRLEMFDEEDQIFNTPEENQDITTTVKDKMEYVGEHVVRYFDAFLQKEATNQQAYADLVIDGKVIAQGLPGTFLLGLESRLIKLRETLREIPVLQYGKSWTLDENKGKNVYVCDNPDEKFKTAKTTKHTVLYPATKEHPAQIDKWDETKNIGKYILTHWSGMIPVKQKSEILARMDKLIRAVKKARQRANMTEVDKRTIGKDIMDYLKI